MKNVLATISYNGRGFNGFQRQPDKRTVQGEIEKTLSYMEYYSVHAGDCQPREGLYSEARPLL